MTKRWRSWLILILGAFPVLIGLMVWSAWFTGRPFDQVAGYDESQIRQGMRLGMADRLVARRTLLGKSRSEVVALLGEPPQTGYFKSWDLVYCLGLERGYIRIDCEWLVLHLDENGKVAANRIVTD